MVIEERGLSMWELSSLTNSTGSFTKQTPLWSKNLFGSAPSGGKASVSPLPAAMEAACWDPSNAMKVYAAWGTELQAWDLRSASLALSIPDAHKVVTRSVDVSRTRPHLIATGGDDCAIKARSIGFMCPPTGLLLPLFSSESFLLSPQNDSFFSTLHFISPRFPYITRIP